MIEEIWQEHQGEKFPSGHVGEEIEGIDLALLDADIAGCVETYIKRRKLDLKHTAILGLLGNSGDTILNYSLTGRGY